MAQSTHQHRLRELLREEAREHFDAMRRVLADAADGPEDRTRALRTALRAAHSVKGGATIAGLVALGALLHNWESCASAVVTGSLTPDDAAIDLLLRAIDAASDELEVRCGAELSERTDPAKMTAELEGHFGGHCELRGIEAEREEVDTEENRPLREATVRIATQKLDRQMASVEELLRLKVGGEDRLLSLSRNVARLEEFRASLAETRQFARSTAVNGRGGSRADALKIGASLDGLVESIDRVLADFSGISTETRQATHALSALADALHSDVRAVRMLPVDAALVPFARMVRELGRTTGKRVRLEVHGGATEVDRDVLEAMKDPVMHLLRNAVDHGIEGPSERELVGKPSEAYIRVEARSSAGMLELEVRDDGRGVMAERVRTAARERGIVPDDQLSQMDDSQLRNLIFHEGFSTAREISDISGRGVGLAVVRAEVERIGGRVVLSSAEGKGTAFKLILPLNLATARFVLVEASGELFALPALSVDRVVRVGFDELVRVDHGVAFELNGKPMPVFRLSDSLSLPPSKAGAERHVALVLGASTDRAAFVVDRIVDERELVARGMGDHLRNVRCVSGVAVLPGGTVAPILNAADLLRGAIAERTPRTSFERPDASETRTLRRILVVDDSVTTRTLEKSILEAAGFQVEVAVDGVEALQRLGRATFDLVLSDVQMPRMDGLSLVRAIKQDPRFSNLPVVLVSSLDTPEQRRLGLDAGSDAYLSKGEFEQGLLLSTLGRFL